VDINDVHKETPVFKYTTKEGKVITLPLNGFAHCRHEPTKTCAIAHSGYTLFESNKSEKALDEIWKYVTSLTSTEKVHDAWFNGNLIEIKIPESMINKSFTIL